MTTKSLKLMILAQPEKQTGTLGAAMKKAAMKS